MDLKTVQEMSWQEVFTRVFWDAISNSFYFGIGTVVIVLISLAFPKIAVGLFVIYIIILGINALWVLANFLLGLSIIPIAIWEDRKQVRKAVREFALSLPSVLVRFIETGVGIALGWYMYQRLF